MSIGVNGAVSLTASVVNNVDFEIYLSSQSQTFTHTVNVASSGITFDGKATITTTVGLAVSLAVGIGSLGASLGGNGK